MPMTLDKQNRVQKQFMKHLKVVLLQIRPWWQMENRWNLLLHWFLK